MQQKIVTVTLNPAIDRTCYVEGFQEGLLNRVTHSGVDAGGKGINVARALKHFGIQALASGFNGGGQGTLLESLLDKEQISHDFHRVCGETRTNIKIADGRSGITTELNESGFLVSDSEISGFVQKLVRLSDQADFLVLSGSLPKGIDSDFYARIIERFNRVGLRILLDADNEALRLGAKAGPYAVKPNLSEMSRLCGKSLDTDKDVAEEAQKLLAKGVELAVVTMGERGLLLITRERVIKASPFPIKPLCTTGSGDTVLAALVYGLVQKMPLEGLAAFMTCAGTLSCTTKGTGCCRLEDILPRVHEIELEYL